MRGRLSKLLLCAMATSVALHASGQASRSRTTNIELGSSGHGQRLPYTAEYKITQVKTLSDGSTITHESTEVVALDSQGRSMTSTTTMPTSQDQSPITRVNVYDPVAGTNSSWSVPGHQATVTQMPAPGSLPPCASTVMGAVANPRPVQREKPVVEDLGTETIQGVEARGRRTTTTIPAGAIGNDAPLVRTRETWTAIAPGLGGLLVREVSDDPQLGQTTKELQNLSQDEPDPSLFQPPAGYEIVNKDAAGCSSSNLRSVEPASPPVQ